VNAVTMSELSEPTGSAATTEAGDGELVAVCPLDRLVPERGAAVLLHGHQVALFRIEGGAADGGDRVYAVSHHDPFSEANVMARGIVGSSGDRVTVASPMYKQVFDLATGVCLTEPDVRLPVWRTRIEEGFVYLDPQPVLLDAAADDTAAPAVPSP
jgi:nitrite reductase (NADH) small subunit